MNSLFINRSTFILEKANFRKLHIIRITQQRFITFYKCNILSTQMHGISKKKSKYHMTTQKKYFRRWMYKHIIILFYFTSHNRTPKFHWWFKLIKNLTRTKQYKSQRDKRWYLKKKKTGKRNTRMLSSSSYI